MKANDPGGTSVTASKPSPSDPILDDEGILRRVPDTIWQPGKSRPLPWVVFKPVMPNKNTVGDADGLSVSRQVITSAITLSQHPNGKKYHVACLAAKSIRDVEVSIQPDPQEHDQGHCLLPELNSTAYGQRGDPRKRIIEIAERLAKCSEIVFESA